MPVAIRPLPQLSERDIARFLATVDDMPGHGPQEDCWKWTGVLSIPLVGYGVFTRQKIQWRASRIAYRLHFGADPYPLCICHTCDWPPCVNPGHLFKGTSQENLADMWAKGRGAAGETHMSKLHPELVLRGESNGSAKLTENQVDAIRTMRSSGLYLLREIGQQFGISFQQVSRIVHGQRWAHTAKPG